ncbi:MAG TPA: methylenetetrahydrofolate reductase [NAD(P)H] [Candidatus Eisenbacteria bacterium]|nr:methylenetetrahydrofolate reductase [NAD(P)H] [Candidatus Eisenbacteria bacterium]
MTDIPMTLLTRVLEAKKTFSFEVFPPKTPEGHARLLETIGKLCALKPDFISCTYGAGGGNRDRTFEIVEHIQTVYGIPSMAHLTCVSHSRAEIAAILEEFERRKIRNILALRGDPPQEASGVSREPGDFRYSSDLVAFIRARFQDRVSIGVAGFPETHVLSKDADSDARFLKEKIRAGADFVITQLFFDNRHYFDYVERLRKIGVHAPVIPGILPITDYAALKRFCERCGASVSREVHDLFGPLADDPAGTLEAGTAFAIKQCRELLKGGAPGIHFYALNKTHPVDDILKALRNSSF